MDTKRTLRDKLFPMRVFKTRKAECDKIIAEMYKEIDEDNLEEPMGEEVIAYTYHVLTGRDLLIDTIKSSFILASIGGILFLSLIYIIQLFSN